MVRQLIYTLIMHLWNKYVEFQKPVDYTRTETNNNHTFKHANGDIVHLLEVKQVILRRKPRFPFRVKKRCVYVVTEYVFRGEDFVSKLERDMPEFCSSLFRNTKIPHVLAVNAFLEFNKGG